MLCSVKAFLKEAEFTFHIIRFIYHHMGCSQDIRGN